MNFSSQSAKPKAKSHNEDFQFEVDTPRGHFFTVLDFAAHDYANLNATLKGKLETIVGSFVSLSSFSAELFVGFVAKEINNFVHNLGQQSGGPELLYSAAVCLVSGNKLFYFLCGDSRINILSSGRLLPLFGTAPKDLFEAEMGAAGEGLGEAVDKRLAQLGGRSLEAPLTNLVQAFTMQDEDVVLIMTGGLATTLDEQQLASAVKGLAELDAKLICESLMKASRAAADDRTLVVIVGPYERYVDPLLVDLSKSVASVEARLDALTENEQRKPLEAVPLETGEEAQPPRGLSQQLEVLREDLRSKAAGIDLLELDQKLRNLGAELAGKADMAALLGLQRDVLKLGLVANESAAGLPEAEGAAPPGTDDTVSERRKESVSREAVDDQASAGFLPQLRRAVAAMPGGSATARPLAIALGVLVLIIGLAAGFAGGWLQSRLAKSGPEVWTVKAAGSQIVIGRQDRGETESVTLNLGQPVKAAGEQTFSSFADARQFIDTITGPEVSVVESRQASQPNQLALVPDKNPSEPSTEVMAREGDSLKRLAQVYKVPPEKLQELNPGIRNWKQIQIGQKIVVPSPDAISSPTPEVAASPTPPEPTAPVAAHPGNTTEVRLKRGESLNEIALRFHTSVERLKQLNPQIGNWRRVQIGEKINVPAGR